MDPEGRGPGWGLMINGKTVGQTHLGSREHAIGQEQRDDSKCEEARKLIYETGYTIEEGDSDKCVF